jgi:hypothetical protein
VVAAHRQTTLIFVELAMTAIWEGAAEAEGYDSGITVASSVFAFVAATFIMTTEITCLKVLAWLYPHSSSLSPNAGAGTARLDDVVGRLVPCSSLCAASAASIHSE